MTPIRLSYIWYRRLYTALLLISLGYIALYVLHAVDIQYIPLSARVELIPAIASTVVALASIVCIVLAKKITSYLPSVIIFSIFIVTTAYLTQSTGGVQSDFLAIWALVVLVSPVFGASGWLLALVMIASYVAAEYLSGGLATETLILIGLSSVLPLIVGVVLWREVSGSEEASERNVKHLASQLSEVATKSEIVINAIADGVIAVDSKGAIQLINPAAQEMLGWGKQDALMLSYKSILKFIDENGKDLDSRLDPIQEVLNNNQQSQSNKLSVLTNSGKKMNISIESTPIGDVGSGAIAVFRDVTKERAEEREQAEFISTASHEMRTPVASIEGYLGLALNANTATVDIRARDFITKAHESAQHLGRLFQDLLDVSKSEDGRMTTTPRVLDIVPYAETIVQGLTPKATEKGLRLTFVPGEGNGTERGLKKVMPMYYVNLDNDHIREVLDNLIENAIKYTPSGEIRVDINGTEDAVIISVKDSGLGIPIEDIPHLFQKFYRVSNSDRQAIGGTGLGLFLCRRLVEAMQGRIWVESEFQKGSTFFVELPRISSQEADELKEQQAHQAPVIVPQTPNEVPASMPAPTQAPTPAPIQAPAGTPITVTFADTSPAQGVAPMPTPPAAPVAPVQQPLAANPVIMPPAPLPAPNPAVAAPAPVVPQQQFAAPAQPAVSDATAVKPATTVPRGDSLTRDQINERVRQLEALAQQQRGSVSPPSR